MTMKEQSEAMFRRAKMRAAGVTDVRLMPKAVQKLNDREIGLVNATFEKLTTEAEQTRLAA